MKKINPTNYNLSPRVVLYEIKPDVIVIVKNRKSRIIMKDGKQITAMANKIRKNNKKIKIEFKTTAPVCSKTKRFLESQGIKTIQTDNLDYEN